MTEMNDEFNRNFEIADHIDWLAVAQVDDVIAKTNAKIKKLEARKAELQANDHIEAELVSIERDLRYETNHLANLKADRRAMLGYLD